jgi:glycosyltransferase involved in cell wall biosynthesis
MKKKILFMVQVPPPVHGAALRNLSLYESKLLHDSFDIKLLPLAFADSILTIGKFSVKKIAKSFQYAFRLIRTLFSYKPDIAYFTITPAGGAFYRDCLFVLILKMTNTKIVYHLRGIGIEKARKKNFLNKVLYRFAFKNTYIVCLSQKHLEDIKGLNYKKHFVVPNGIKVEMNPAWQPTTANGKTRLLFLSNFVKSKGVYEFLETLTNLKKEQVNFEATIVGADYDVTLADIQKYIADHQLGDRVKASGALFKEEKFRLISNSDIFIFPTYYPFELFPGVILEAMQCSKPVVSTYHGVIENIIDNGVTGLLVDTRNADQLTEKTRYLIEHPEEAKAIGKRAGEKFYKEYTLEKFEQNIKQVFEQV